MKGDSVAISSKATNHVRAPTLTCDGGGSSDCGGGVGCRGATPLPPAPAVHQCWWRGGVCGYLQVISSSSD